MQIVNDKSEEVWYLSQIEVRNDIADKMKQRAKYIDEIEDIEKQDIENHVG